MLMSHPQWTDSWLRKAQGVINALWEKLSTHNVLAVDKGPEESASEKEREAKARLARTPVRFLIHHRMSID